MPRIAFIRAGLWVVAVTVNDHYEIRTARAFTERGAHRKLFP